MNKSVMILAIVISFLAFSGCSKILEPVLINISDNKNPVNNLQEEFLIDIRSLNFKSASQANKSPYSRELMLDGSGARANVLDEKVFLKTNINNPLKNEEYILGIGDILVYQELREFNSDVNDWPEDTQYQDYILGIGDKLILSQLKENSNITVNLSQEGELIDSKKEEDQILSSEGIVGSNGNVLLLGMGNIEAVDKTLYEVRNEIRNIFIRGGLAPNFQLEISDFKSKKAFVTIDDYNSKITTNIIQLDNIPLTLKEVAKRSGLSGELKDQAMITLFRNDKEYKIVVGELFKVNTSRVLVQDKDQIEIDFAKGESYNIKAVIGPKGYILLPRIGQIKALNRTLNSLQKEIEAILIKKDLKPNFQLDISEFHSKKAFLINKNVGSSIIAIGNTKNTLKEVLLANKSLTAVDKVLTVITITRGKEVYQLTGEQILDPTTPSIYIQADDQIEIEKLKYKTGQVYALSGLNSAEIIPIDPSVRETLANVLFVKNGPLSNISVKRSEIYLLRGRNPSIAYHLDAQNVSRILVAANTELRPNDIIYVAERPIVSFSRVLAELTPLRALLRDIKNNNIP